MPWKYRHIKGDEKKLIEYKTGNRPLFYCQFGCFCTVCTIVHRTLSAFLL